MRLILFQHLFWFAFSLFGCDSMISKIAIDLIVFQHSWYLIISPLLFMRRSFINPSIIIHPIELLKLELFFVEMGNFVDLIIYSHRIDIIPQPSVIIVGTLSSLFLDDLFSPVSLWTSLLLWAQYEKACVIISIQSSNHVIIVSKFGVWFLNFNIEWLTTAKYLCKFIQCLLISLDC